MADKSTTTREIKLVAGFVDGDERTLRFNNPKSTITAAQIEALNASASAVLIGDKYGAPFNMFLDAEIVDKVVTDLDLTPQP